MAFTFFFRDLQILELAVQHVVPQLIGRSKGRIWDAGCAMGPECFSLAILLSEKIGYFGFKNLTIHASDIDETDTFGKTIQTGVYSEEETKRIPPDIFQKYFVPNGRPGHFQVVDAVRQRIVFQKHDLLSLQPIGNNFSLILCKNVLLHFQPSQRVEVIEMFHRSLAPGGFLATEQTQKMPKEVEHLFRQVADDGQIFQRTEMDQSRHHSGRYSTCLAR